MRNECIKKLQLTFLYIIITRDKKHIAHTDFKVMLLSLFFPCCLVGFFRWTIQAQPHFWPWHACPSQALYEKSDPQSERADAYSLARRNYQERLEPLILGINCQAENQTERCPWRARFSMAAAFLFQITVRTLQFAFNVSRIFRMLWLNTEML